MTSDDVISSGADDAGGPARDGLPPLREVIARHGLAARKALGQNFLLDLNLTDRIARCAGDITDGTVIEIGPGPGGLTRALLARGAQVIAIERDDRCRPALDEIAAAYPGQLEVIAADAMDLDATTLGAPPRRVVANLPYNVGTALLITWLRRADAFASITVLLQKEVVDRLVATPGSKNYGRLSVLANWRCETRAEFIIGPRAFTPPPKVTSRVVTLIPRATPLFPAPLAALERVTQAAFGQRRKMLRSSLKSLGDAQALCAAAGLEPTARAETIGIEGFCALARAWTAAFNKT